MLSFHVRLFWGASMNRRCNLTGGLLRTLPVPALVCLIASVAAFGQGVTGSFTGTVKDSSGAIVPNASVKVRSVDSGREWHNTDNELVLYYVPTLPPVALDFY